MSKNYKGIGVKQELIENYVKFENLLNSFICCICLEIVKNPMECENCESLYCEECWDMMKISGKKCVLHCTAPVKKASKFVRDALSNLRITCETCGKKDIEYNMYVLHFEVCGIFNGKDSRNKEDLLKYIKEKEMKIDEITAEIENFKLNGIDAVLVNKSQKNFFQGDKSSSVNHIKENNNNLNTNSNTNSSGVVIGNNVFIGGNVFINGVRFGNFEGINNSNINNSSSVVSNNQQVQVQRPISQNQSQSPSQIRMSDDDIRKRLLTFNLPLNQKMEMYNAAVEGKLNEFKELIIVKKYPFFEEVSAHTFLWTCFHYAMHYGKEEIIMFCFEHIDKTLKCLNTAMRLTSNDGRCPMLCLLRSNSLSADAKKMLLVKIFSTYKTLEVTNNAKTEIRTRDLENIIKNAKGSDL
jgi:hypothetical protein